MTQNDLENPQVLLESMTESVLLTDIDLDYPGPTILYVNPAFEKMTGWTAEEIMGKSPRLLQGEKTDRSIFSDMKTLLQSGQIWEGQTVNYRKDGSEFVMEWSIVPILDEHGIIHQYLAVQKDVTAKVLLEQKLEQSRQLERKRYEELEISNRKLNELNSEIKTTLDLFYKYVPKEVINKALQGHEAAVYEGEELEAALLFCDIRNFTSICDNITPNDVVYLLNTFYKTMLEVIKAHHGTVNQFVGDEIFVSFGTPVFVKNPEEQAVRCALAMRDALQPLNETLKKRIRSEITAGFGINYGTVIAGNLGSEDRLSYSLTGDPVNTAKRIEMLSKDQPNTILVSEPVYKVTRHLFETKSWGPRELKGKFFKIEIYEILGTQKDLI